jgi:putative hydrolase of the HAD superfamily
MMENRQNVQTEPVTIRAVVFDMGGTLEELYYDDTSRMQAAAGLRELLTKLGLDPGMGLSQLNSTVLAGMRAYQEWREAEERELPPERVWTEYVFPDHGLPKKRLEAAAEDVTFFYETHYQTRSLRPEAPAVLEELHRKRFRLAIISNMISRGLVQRKLVEYGIACYFDAVLTSSNFGWRKPNRSIFEEATRLLRLPSAACAYVGDTISRDVIGARRAGYGLAIQIPSFLTSQADCGTEAESLPDCDLRPDAVVSSLTQVVDLVSTNIKSTSPATAQRTRSAAAENPGWSSDEP